jgi:acyl-CoA thioester hydrolase
VRKSCAATCALTRIFPPSPACTVTPQINHVPRPTPTSPPPLGLIVSSSTAYASSVAYPSPVIAALGVSSLGKSSVTWRVALFEGEYVDPASSSSSSSSSEETSSLAGWTLQDVMSGNGGVGRQVRLKSRGGEPPRAAAYGDMVHVFVDPESRRPLPDGMDPALRAALQKLQVKQ